MQDLGKERVEERVTGVDEVDAMRGEFSLRLKTKDQNRNKDLKLYHFEKMKKGMALIPIMVYPEYVALYKGRSPWQWICFRQAI